MLGGVRRPDVIVTVGIKKIGSDLNRSLLRIAGHLAVFVSGGRNFAPFKINDLTGELWFVAVDVCRILELDNVTAALRALDADEKGLTNYKTLGGEQSVNAVTEPQHAATCAGSKDTPGSCDRDYFFTVAWSQSSNS